MGENVEKLIADSILARCEKMKNQGSQWFLYCLDGHGGTYGPLRCGFYHEMIQKIQNNGYGAEYGDLLECHLCEEKHEGFKIDLNSLP